MNRVIYTQGSLVNAIGLYAATCLIGVTSAD